MTDFYHNRMYDFQFCFSFFYILEVVSKDFSFRINYSGIDNK